MTLETGKSEFKRKKRKKNVPVKYDHMFYHKRCSKFVNIPKQTEQTD